MILGNLDNTQGKCRAGLLSEYSDETESYDGGMRVRVPVEIIFSLISLSRPFLGANQSLSNGYWGLYPRGQGGWGVTITTHPHLALKIRKDWNYSSTSRPILRNLLNGFTKMELLH
jgi:hypothetical protein